MIAPLMTCSARLPVYALLIGAFIPQRAVGPFNLRGLVLFALYLAGVVSALAVAFVLKRTVMRGEYRPLLLELPEYRLAAPVEPRARAVGARAHFPRRASAPSFSTLMVVLWFLASFPAPPAGATGPAIQYSIAGFLGRGLEYCSRPIGFNWQISIALVPGLAAREVAVSALGTVYAMSGAGRCRGRARAGDRPQLEHRDRAVAARLVRVRAAVPVDARGGEARNQLLALSAVHGGLPVRARLPGALHHLPGGARARRRGAAHEPACCRVRWSPSLVAWRARCLPRGGCCRVAPAAARARRARPRCPACAARHGWRASAARPRAGAAVCAAARRLRQPCQPQAGRGLAESNTWCTSPLTMRSW